LDLLGTAAEVLTMCCFFGAAWVRPCCIGMIRVGSYEKSITCARKAARFLGSFTASARGNERGGGGYDFFFFVALERSCILSAPTFRAWKQEEVGMYRLIVFDWDGTLMDSVARIVEAFQGAIAEGSLAPRTDAEIRHIIGLGLWEAVRALYPQQDEADLLALINAYRTHFVASQVPTPLFAGAREVLYELAAQGYLLAVATGKSRRGLAHSLEESGLRDLFHSSRCAEETCSKPDPRMLHEIMAELQVSPGETLMIGDSEYDLNMAAAAGSASLAVSFGVHDCTRLRACAPLDCLHRLADLPPWLRDRKTAQT
jgi:phosphoglycolate phosphatase